MILNQIRNGGQCTLDTLVVGDCACLLIKRHIKINTYDYSFTGDFQIFYIFLWNHSHVSHTPCILSP